MAGTILRVTTITRATDDRFVWHIFLTPALRRRTMRHNSRTNTVETILTIRRRQPLNLNNLGNTRNNSSLHIVSITNTMERLRLFSTQHQRPTHVHFQRRVSRNFSLRPIRRQRRTTIKRDTTMRVQQRLGRIMLTIRQLHPLHQPNKPSIINRHR